MPFIRLRKFLSVKISVVKMGIEFLSNFFVKVFATLFEMII